MLYIYLLCSFLLNPTSSSQPLGWLVSSDPSSYLPTGSYVVLLHNYHPPETRGFISLYNFSRVIVCMFCISLTRLFVVPTTFTIYLMSNSLTPTERRHLRDNRTNRQLSKSELTYFCVSNLCGLLFVIPTGGLSLVGSLLSSVTIDTINNQRYNTQTGF